MIKKKTSESNKIKGTPQRAREDANFISPKFNYMLSACPEMVAEETGSLEKFVENVEQQGIISWQNKVNMTTMTRTRICCLTTRLATA